MKSILATILLMFLATLNIYSQDTLKTNTSVSLSTRNYCRGINFGDGPSVQGTVELSKKSFTLGTFVCVTDNRTHNWGTTTDSYLSYNYKNLTVGVHDYFFFNKVDSLNDFFFQTGKGWMTDSTLYYREGHYLEGQLKFTGDKISLIAAYNFYATTCDIFKKTVYLEGEYKLSSKVSFILGLTTGGSAVNFYTDKYNSGFGVTCVGFNFNRKVEFTDKFSSDLKIQTHVNPNYKNIADGLQKTPFNMIVSLTF